jgi:hypothetical protein
MLEVLIVYYNNYRAQGRNLFIKKTCETSKVKEFITDTLKSFTPQSNGYVLVKFKGQMWICERNNINPASDYVKHPIQYHPLSSEFTA